MTDCSNSKFETSISEVLSLVLACDHSSSERNLDIMIKIYGQTSFSFFRSQNYIKPVVQEYMYSKRQGPQLPFKLIMNEAKDLLFSGQFDANFAWLLSRRSVSAIHIPSWTGYHIKLRSRVPVKKNFVGYLDCLDAPATEMSTMHEQLKPKEFSSLFLMIGTFRVLLMSLGVIGAWFRDAGMRDLYIV